VFFVASCNILIKAKGILKKPYRLTTFGRSNIKKYNYILTVICGRKKMVNYFRRDVVNGIGLSSRSSSPENNDPAERQKTLFRFK